ncbi:hypothetical protein A0J61_08650 [Choanephora cucurbitarum]|uniref:Uncharacterized protein n=1 Tax=Choanephora cucurbitarum TaxID=101091 RepID=A0A1C7N2H6_9FUNG|nr:hypothetical protein A0J61_08650 [Choanephora cucurbitarum]
MEGQSKSLSKSGNFKTNLEQQEKSSLINDDKNELLDLINLAKELPVVEHRILEPEDNATENSNDTLPRKRIKALVAVLRAALYSNPQENSYITTSASIIDLFEQSKSQI